MLTLSRRFCTFPKLECYVKQVRLTQALKEGDADLGPLFDSGKVLLYHKNKVLVTRDDSSKPLWQDFKSFNEIFPDANSQKNAVFLGLDNLGNTARFAIHLSSAQLGATENCETNCHGHLTDFRFAMLQASQSDANLIAQASALLNWNRITSFCSNCGTGLVRNAAGSQRSCPSCKSVHYPKMSPVGIVLVTDKDRTKLLLVRQSRHPPGMFTCIAGFMDMGESLEETIKREVAEEVGLLVTDVSYKGSQHWPFPQSSVMFGCEAVVEDLSQVLSIDTKELEDGRWFTRSEIENAILTVAQNPSNVRGSATEIFVPPSQTIAHQMVKSWLETC